eukprot:3807494-Pleurochrysis_carterae.AAC.3
MAWRSRYSRACAEKAAKIPGVWMVVASFCSRSSIDTWSSGSQRISHILASVVYADPQDQMGHGDIRYLHHRVAHAQNMHTPIYGHIVEEWRVGKVLLCWTE